MSSIEENITLLKGIHPGIILERELKKRKLPKRRIALTIGEYPQLLGDITFNVGYGKNILQNLLKQK